MDKNNNIYRYKFSVIMAVYNTEKYVGDAIESIINQTIGFKENIQLILINDGSTDSSGKICEKYRDAYPENIVYEEKKNGGAADARNAGRKYVEGKYLNFFDSDDLWDKNAFEEVYDFFEKHQDEIDVITCKLEEIGAKRKNKHPLDHKYSKGNRLIDLCREYDSIQAGNGNVFFKTEALKDKMYDTSLPIAEDAFFIGNLFIRNPLYGAVASAVYNYRKRSDLTSLSDIYIGKKEFYFDVPELYYREILKTAASELGYIPKFIQYMVVYDIQWKVRYTDYMKKADDAEKNEYYNLIKSVLSMLDDEVILSAKDINQYKRLYLLDLKYDGIWKQPLALKSGRIFFDGNAVLNFKARSFLDIRAFGLKKNTVALEGYISNHLLGKDISVWLEDHNGKKYELIYEYDDTKDVTGIIGEHIVRGRRFKVEIPLLTNASFAFKTVFDGNVIDINPRFDATSYIDDKSSNSYRTIGEYIITKRANKIMINKRTLLNLLMSEIRYIRRNISKRGKRWVSERLFEFRLEHISKKSKIRNRVACISFRSNDHFIGNMKAISEHLDIPITTFKGMRPHSRKQKLEACRKIFGSKVVVIDDYNLYLRKYGKRPGQKIIQLWHACGAFKKFGADVKKKHPAPDNLYHEGYDVVTVSSENIRDAYANAFGLETDKIQALGCARTDVFFDEEYRRKMAARVLEAYPLLRDKQIIVYAPTFRDIPGKPRSHFKLMFDPDILAGKLDKNQVFIICPHPVITEPILPKDYDNILEIRDISTNDMMFVTDLLITDYSSVIFEFSLLQKPMAFYCSDFDTYDRDFYLDYENDLPGPLLKSEDELYAYICKRQYSAFDKHDLFVDKHMGACDGNSCTRIAELIKEQLEA